MGWIWPYGHLGRWAKCPCLGLLAGHLLAITGKEKTAGHTGSWWPSSPGAAVAWPAAWFRWPGAPLGPPVARGRCGGPVLRVSRHGSLPKWASGGEYSTVAKWRELSSTGVSSEGGLEEEVLKTVALGSGMAAPTQWGGDADGARGPAMEEWYGSSWSCLCLHDVGRWSSGGRHTRQWPGPNSGTMVGGARSWPNRGEVAQCRGKRNGVGSLLHRKKSPSWVVAWWGPSLIDSRVGLELAWQEWHGARPSCGLSWL
jgi:hypothetical protein